jgi:hypothetical protein
VAVAVVVVVVVAVLSSSEGHGDNVQFEVTGNKCTSLGYQVI